MVGFGEMCYKISPIIIWLDLQPSLLLLWLLLEICDFFTCSQLLRTRTIFLLFLYFISSYILFCELFFLFLLLQQSESWKVQHLLALATVTAFGGRGGRHQRALDYCSFCCICFDTICMQQQQQQHHKTKNYIHFYFHLATIKTKSTTQPIMTAWKERRCEEVRKQLFMKL